MRFVLNYLLFIIYTATVSGNPKFRCDYKYFRSIPGWLKYHRIPATWGDARLRCQMEGAVIASPMTQNLKTAMLSLLKDSKVRCPFFTGIHATFSKGDYASVEGVPLSQIPHTWMANEPDNYKDQEDALVMLEDGTLSDVSSKDTYPYFCYKKKTNLIINSCGTTDPEYNFDARTGHCYKFHRVPRTWSRAYMNCMAEGGYLVIINSDIEAAVVRELYAKNPTSSMIGNFWKEVVFVGFHDWNEHGEWRTIHGETLEEAGYKLFSPGLPDNATTGEYCGSIFRSAMLNDIWCENKYAFICEKDPNSLTCEDQDIDEKLSSVTAT